MSSDAWSILDRVLDLVVSHNRWRGVESVNLIASENKMSPLATLVYITDMMHRYAEGKPYKRYYQGLVYVDEIEVLASRLMGELLDTEFVDVRPVSGTIANASVFRSYAKIGDKALVIPVQAGAHVSHTRYGTLGGLGIEQVEMPFDYEEFNVDVDKAVKMVEEVKPSIVVLGGSVYLFPHPVKELAEAAHSVGAVLMYDAAHVLGLITGRVWENPLKQGADLLTSSTHKTFPGPQGGIVAATSKQLLKPVSKTVFPVFVSNHHLHRLPALAVTAIEMKLYGHDYAEAITRNAKALAEALAEQGFKVLAEHKGYTRSHQVLVDVKELGGGGKAAVLLEKANIILNKNMLPWDRPEDIKNPSGLRIGVQEVTRIGMGPDEMKEIAAYMRRVLIDGEDPAKVASEVAEFRRQFTEIKYCIPLSEARRRLGDLAKYPPIKEILDLVH